MALPTQRAAGEEFWEVPGKDLLTRSGPTRRQELARTRAHSEAEDSSGGAATAVCAVMGGCGGALAKAWCGKGLQGDVLDPVMQHVAPSLPDAPDKPVTAPCVAARFLHGIRGTFPTLIQQYLRRGAQTQAAGVGSALRRLLQKLRDRLQRLGCVKMEDPHAAVDAHTHEDKAAKSHARTIASHPDSQWMCAEGRLAGVPDRVAILLQLYTSTDTTSKGDMLACCDLYCECFLAQFLIMTHQKPWLRAPDIRSCLMLFSLFSAWKCMRIHKHAAILSHRRPCR